MDKRRTFPAPLIITIVVLVVLLPMLYVLSYGPVAWCGSKGYIPEYCRGFLSWFYAPIVWLDGAFPPFRSFFEWYVELFVKYKRTPSGSR